MSEDRAPIPTSTRGLRACLRCRLLKTTKQWTDRHCENCSERYDRIETTPVWKGMVAMMQPRTSWVARWQKQTTQVPGLYAMQVSGQSEAD